MSGDPVAAEERTNRRRFRRRTIRVLVEYRWESGLRCDTATTLGAGGLFIATDEPLPDGTPLKLAFDLPGSDVRHEIEGVVAWSHRPAAGVSAATGMGIAFRDRAAIGRLARAIDALDG